MIRHLCTVAVVLLIAFALTACGHKPPPKPVVTTVYVKVKEPCIRKERVPVKPTYRFGKGPMPGDKEAAAILTEDFEAAEQYGNAWEAATTGCISAPASPASSGK